MGKPNAMSGSMDHKEAMNAFKPFT
jgi:hypothetical protein